MVLILAILFLKIALSCTVLLVGTVIFDALAYSNPRTPTPDGVAIFGGIVTMASLVFYIAAAILFIFS